MKILDDLLSTLDLEGTAVRDVRIGTFQTAVFTRYCGLASTPLIHGYRHGEPAVMEAGNLIQKHPQELVRMAYSAQPLEAAIGMAAINSLLEVDETLCTELNARDLIIEKGKGKNVALIGHFPFVPQLRQAARKLWVIEQNPQEGDLPEETAETFIPQAQVVGITGSAFINHTIERLLKLCPPQAYVVILGGTAPLSPVLFDYGASAISGIKVIDTETALRCVSQGATFRQVKGIRLLTMRKAV